MKKRTYTTPDIAIVECNISSIMAGSFDVNNYDGDKGDNYGGTSDDSKFEGEDGDFIG